MNIVIVAGGGGTRLWPKSRRREPKQFQKIFGDRSLIELTRLRLGDRYQASSIYYAVTPETVAHVRSIFPDVAEDHIIVEPEKRDTGPAIGYVVARLAMIAPDEPVIFLWSDHYIADYDKFRGCLDVADQLVRRHGVMVNIGIVPTWPNPELGYTRLGDRVDEQHGIEVFQFAGFVEKPSAGEAKEMIASGEYLWNGGYFTWTPKKFLEAFHALRPDMYSIFLQMQKEWRRGNDAAIAPLYARLEKISIDYAVIRQLHAKQVFTIKAPFDWSDVGLWSAVKKLREQSPDDVVTEGSTHVGIDTADCLLYGPEGKIIATVGVEHLVVVDTEDALLICAKDRSSAVKRLVEKLKEENQEHVL